MNPLLPPPEGQNGTPHFNGLTGPGFEKMIFDLIRAENPGGDFFPDNPTQQEGSDMFFTRKDGKRVFIECKGRQDWFSGSELKKAVDKFLSGEMSH